MAYEIPPPGQAAIEDVRREQFRRLALAESAADRGIKFIEIWNGGGAVAMLSFWGAVPEIRGTCLATAAIVLFLIGLIATAACVIVVYEHSRIDYERFNALSGEYYESKIRWDDLWSRDEDYRDSRAVVAPYLGYLAALLALAGTVTGVWAALGQ